MYSIRWKRLKWAKMISGYDTGFDFHVKFAILGFFMFSTCFHQTCMSKTASLKHAADKVPSAKWPHKPREILCAHQNLDFSIGFVTKISIFELRPLFRFLCLINSFYRTYASCIYNIYPIYPIYPYNRANISKRYRWFKDVSWR